MAVAARRSGKTVACRAKLYSVALGTKYALVGYCGPTLNQAIRLLWTSIARDMRDPMAERFVRNVNASEHTIFFRNESQLRIYGAERPEQIRGDGFDAFIVDEADDPNYDQAFFDEIVGPALSDQQGQLIQVGSPKGRGRLFREFQKGQLDSATFDVDYESTQVTAIDAGILKPEEIERARRLRSDRAFRQEYMADFLAPAGIVYDEWDERVHVVPDAHLPERLEQVIVGVDWGTSNRGAMIVIGLDRVWLPPSGVMDGQYLARAWVIEEHSHAGLGYDDGGWWDVARGIQRRWQPSAWYCDPAGGVEGYIKQLDRALTGGGSHNVVSAKNQVRPGISTVRDLLHHSMMQDDVGPEDLPRLHVVESCRALRGEFGSYRYKSHPRSSDDFLEEPVKENDHCLDALRYALFTHLDVDRPGRRRAA